MYLCTWALIAFLVVRFLLRGFHRQVPGDPTRYRFSGSVGL
ncbi:hypothetical protein ACFYYM_40300 [Streptomyces erythrochromogenes]